MAIQRWWDDSTADARTGGRTDSDRPSKGPLNPIYMYINIYMYIYVYIYMYIYVYI